MKCKVDSITATIRTEFEGIHCYPDAPEEVFYLKYPHRHMFQVEVEFDVVSNDREVEFIMAKHKLNKYIDVHKDLNGVWNMGTSSCEQVAQGILGFMTTVLGDVQRAIIVTVSEDGENGASVYGVIQQGE